VHFTTSFDSGFLAELKKRAADTGMTAAEIIEQAVRPVLALPPAEEPGGETDGLAFTRSERTMLHELEHAGPGWHSSADLAERTGFTVHVAERALKALARSGKAFEWGPGRRMPEPDVHFVPLAERGSCWGSEPPMAALQRLIAGSKAAGIQSLATAQRAAIAMSRGVAEIEPFRRACVEAFWPHLLKIDYSRCAIQNFAELEIDEAASEQENRQRREEQHQREIEEQFLANREHEAEQRRLDEEFRRRRLTLSSESPESPESAPDYSWLRH
jgi:hypothetical protein